MPGLGRRRDKRRRRKRHDGEFRKGRGRRQSLMVATWSIVFALAAMGAIVTAVFLWLRPGETSSAGVTAGTGQGPVRDVKVKSRFPSPSEDEAIALAKQAVLARNAGAVEKYFRLDGTNPSAALMFLEGMSKHDGPVTGFDWIGSMDQNGLLIDAVAIRSKSEDNVKIRIAMFTPDEKGVWKTDFNAFARTCIPPWNEIAKEGSQGGKVRAYFRRDSYYNGVFSDEKDWICHSLSSPDGNETLLGYSRVGSGQSGALDRILRRAAAAGAGKAPAQAVLELRRVDGGEARQFEITRVLAEGWVMAPVAFDETVP